MIYTINQLNNNLESSEVEYVINSISDIKQKEIDFINKSDYKFIYDYHINKTNLNFNQSIDVLQNYYPKTYNYLISKNLSYQSVISWYKLSDWNLSLTSFFELNQRMYFLTEPRRDYYDLLPNYLKDSWLQAFGGVLLSDSAIYVQGGNMLIGDPYSCWRSFDIYLTNSKKRTKKIIESLVQKIPYAFINIDIEEIEKQKKHQTKGFPNLRVMIDCCKPNEEPEDYDLILMCYYYDQRMFWVKDGDFIDGLYEITSPAQMLDAYFLHVFSQVAEDYSRFDFSAWARKL